MCPLDVSVRKPYLFLFFYSSGILVIEKVLEPSVHENLVVQDAFKSSVDPAELYIFLIYALRSVVPAEAFI